MFGEKLLLEKQASFSVSLNGIELFLYDGVRDVRRDVLRQIIAVD